MASFASALESLKNENVFLYLNHSVADFTIDRKLSLHVLTNTHRMEIPLPFDAKELMITGGMLTHYLGGSERLIYGWHLKNLFSYFLGITGKPLILDGYLVDISIFEHYVGIKQTMPNTYMEAKNRALKALSSDSIGKLSKINREVYIPLIRKTIPDLETVGILDKRTKKKLFGYYDIASQINGRMRSSKSYSEGFSAHSSTTEERLAFRPPFFDYKFLYLDYKNMEVSVLQWLSKDRVLGEILNSGQDVYGEIWNKLTKTDCNAERREICKAVFLPVVFGQGIKSIVENNCISEKLALALRKNIYLYFSEAMDWVKKESEKVVDGIYRDYFGRTRSVDDETYKARNASVQSPASLLCLEKLILLDNTLKTNAKIGLHIHDGYVIYAKEDKLKETKNLAIEALESPSGFFPGLKLKVSCKIGEDLENMKEF